MPTISKDQVVEMELTLTDLIEQLEARDREVLDLHELVDERDVEIAGLREALNRVRKERDG